MKKIALLLALTLVLGCTGCSKSGVSQEDYDELKQSYEELQSQYDELAQAASAEPETVPEETTEPESAETTEPETETEEPETSNLVKASIITDDALEEAAAESSEIRGGTNQNDAVLLPMNTKLYGKASGTKGLWYAFTTGENANAVYNITTINKTVGTGLLELQVFDEYGSKLNPGNHNLHAKDDGIASTLSMEFDPNTTYYLYIFPDRNETIDYALTISVSDEQYAGYDIAGSLSEARGTAGALEGNIYPGTNQDDFAMIPTNVKLSSTVSDGIGAWFAFTTGSVENAAYGFTTVNETVGTGSLELQVYDRYGNKLNPGNHNLHAKDDGVASTLSLELASDTIYYIRLFADRSSDTIDYTLSIQAPKEPEAQTATIEEDLIFETPFELNSTQVMFVANKDVFIDENAAKEALKPVADVILAHPDHPILLAGTTATDGTQESCVELSNRRAAAVKNLLVSAYGVPESQIQTIGLGYEADPFVRGKDRDANGKFVESEGAKNRRVVVLDIEDPIAKELLGQ